MSRGIIKQSIKQLLCATWLAVKCLVPQMHCYFLIKKFRSFKSQFVIHEMLFCLTFNIPQKIYGVIFIGQFCQLSSFTPNNQINILARVTVNIFTHTNLASDRVFQLWMPVDIPAFLTFSYFPKSFTSDGTTNYCHGITNRNNKNDYFLNLLSLLNVSP